MTKFIDDLKANGYREGDMSTLPSDISEADRRKVEQHEADLANERVKGVHGQKPVLQQHRVELNPNQYGFAETVPDGETEAKREAAKAKEPPKGNQAEAKADPLDHDSDGRKGGVKPVDNSDKAAKN